MTVLYDAVSLSGLRKGVILLSDDPNIIKNSLALTEAFKDAIRGDKVKEKKHESISVPMSIEYGGKLPKRRIID